MNALPRFAQEGAPVPKGASAPSSSAARVGISSSAIASTPLPANRDTIRKTLNRAGGMEKEAEREDDVIADDDAHSSHGHTSSVSEPS